MYNDPAAGESPRGPIRPDDDAAPGPDAAVPATHHADRVSDPRVCPFLRVVDGGEGLGAPIEAPDPANRCAALREPVPQSLRQQELVCLSSGHVNCPRYLRGALEVEPVRPVRTPRAAPSVNVTPATAGALAIFLAAFLLSLGFVLANGGVVLTAVASTPGAVGRGPRRDRDRTTDSPPRRRSRRPSRRRRPTATPAPTPTAVAESDDDAAAERPPPSRPRPRPPHRRPSRPPAAMRC